MEGLSWFNSQFPATVGIGETGNLGWLRQSGDKGMASYRLQLNSATGDIRLDPAGTARAAEKSQGASGR